MYYSKYDMTSKLNEVVDISGDGKISRESIVRENKLLLCNEALKILNSWRKDVKPNND